MDESQGEEEEGCWNNGNGFFHSNVHGDDSHDEYEGFFLHSTTATTTTTDNSGSGNGKSPDQKMKEPTLVEKMNMIGGGSGGRIQTERNDATDHDDGDDELKIRIGLVEGTMGTLAQCRGPRGEELRESGAIENLLMALLDLLSKIPSPPPSSLPTRGTPKTDDDDDNSNNSNSNNDDDHTDDNQIALLPPPPLQEEKQQQKFELVMKFAIACWGAIRDLACGSKNNRNAIRETSIITEAKKASKATKTIVSNQQNHQDANYAQEDDDNHQKVMEDHGRRSSSSSSGLEILHSYLVLYKNVPAGTLTTATSIGRNLHLKLLTTVIGATRNLTNFTPANSIILHQLGVTNLLIWRLKIDCSTKNDNTTASTTNHRRLPPAGDAFRDGAFRCSTTLINMASYCPECTNSLTSMENSYIIPLLVESWGRAHQKLPLLHPGLESILLQAQKTKHRYHQEQQQQQASLLLNPTTNKEQQDPQQQQQHHNDFYFYDSLWDEILRKESKRKDLARKGERLQWG